MKPTILCRKFVGYTQMDMMAGRSSSDMILHEFGPQHGVLYSNSNGLSSFSIIFPVKRWPQRLGYEDESTTVTGIFCGHPSLGAEQAETRPIMRSLLPKLVALRNLIFSVSQILILQLYPYGW
jgi:hypothetical protein